MEDDAVWIKRRILKELDERLGKIMNDYDVKIRELQERVTLLEKQLGTIESLTLPYDSGERFWDK